MAAGADMSALDWMVVAAGIAAIAWVNWYFFLAERNAAPAMESSVKGGGNRVEGEHDDVAIDTVENGE